MNISNKKAYRYFRVFAVLYWSAALAMVLIFLDLGEISERIAVKNFVLVFAFTFVIMIVIFGEQGKPSPILTYALFPLIAIALSALTNLESAINHNIWIYPLGVFVAGICIDAIFSGENADVL